MQLQLGSQADYMVPARLEYVSLFPLFDFGPSEFQSLIVAIFRSSLANSKTGSSIGATATQLALTLSNQRSILVTVGFPARGISRGWKRVEEFGGP